MIKKNLIIDNFKTLFYAIIIAVLIRSLLIQPFYIPSSSMELNLLVGDRLFVTKYSYGYSKHSFPFSPNIYSGRIPESGPDRGDVAVFKVIKEAWRGGQKSTTRTDYIKRVVGLPGDTIQMKNGRLFINGVKVPRTSDGEFTPSQREGITYRQFIETLPNGVEHKILELGDNLRFDNTPVYKVPPGHYFMMGDNRDNSNDSRADVSFVPAENLVGRADIMFLSIDWRSENWMDFDAGIRWERMLTTIGP